MKDMQLAMLQVLLQNHIANIDNITLKHKEEIEESKLKAKELELKELQELVNVRDSVINQTKKQLNLNKMELIVEEEALESPEAVLKRMKMSFPSLNFAISPVNPQNKYRTQSVTVRIESKGDMSTSDTSVPTITPNTKHISGTLKPLKPVIRNNYIRSNLRYSQAPSVKKSLSKFKDGKDSHHTSSLPQLSVHRLDKPSLSRKPSIIIGQHPKKPYLNIKGPRKMFERAASPSGASITSERTTSSLPHVVRSDTEASSHRRQPIPFSTAIKKMKQKPEIRAKDRMRLDRFKKENFIYSTSAKKLSLAEKYKPIVTPASGAGTTATPATNIPSTSTPSTYLNRVEPTPTSNIARMEDRREGSNIPVISHTERMRNNMQRLNLLAVSDGPKSKGPLKGILKRSGPAINSVSAITSSDLKANTLANSMRNKHNY